MTAQTIIGVDPAFRAGGFWIAIIDYTDRTARFKSFPSVLHFDRWLQSPDAPASALVGVENSNLQNLTFQATGSRAELAKRSRNIGTNQAASQLTVDAARYRYGNGSVIEISPREKGAKWGVRVFSGVVQSAGLTLQNYPDNQDCRDALQVALAVRTKRIYQTA